MKHNVAYKVLIINLLLLPQLIAQSNIDKKIMGIVVDSLTKGFLPNATVMLTKNDSVLGGTTSRNDGSFVIKQRNEGQYLLKIQYIGYASKAIMIDLKKKKRKRQLFQVLCTYYWSRLFGTCATWFLLDVAVYGVGL